MPDWFKKFLTPIFAVIGVIASVLGIWQFLLDYAFPTQGIRATYKTAIAADSASVFTPQAFLIPELSKFRRLVGLDILIWNSGRTRITKDDIEQNIVIRIDKSSQIFMEQPGLERSSVNGHLQLQKQANNEYVFTWDNFFPQNFIERHFLIATDLSKDQLGDVVQIGGALNGNISIKSSSFDDIVGTMDPVSYLLGVVCAFLAVLGLGYLGNFLKKLFSKLPPVQAFFSSKFFSYKIVRVIGGIASTVAFFAVVAVAGFLAGPAMSSYFFGVPGWADPSFFPPYYTERVLTTISAARRSH